MDSTRSDEQSCPLCNQSMYLSPKKIDLHSLWKCQKCKFECIYPQPSNDALGRIYSSNYFPLSENEQGREHASELKQATANLLFKFIESHSSEKPLELLEIGCGHGDLLLVAAERGFKVTGIDFSEHSCEITREKLANYQAEIFSGELGQHSNGWHEKFDVIVFCDVLEHVRAPEMFLKQIYQAAKHGAQIVCVVPSTGSWSARLMGCYWGEYKLEHLSYFNSENLHSLCQRVGFEVKYIVNARKALSLRYVAAHFEKYSVRFVTPLLRTLQRILPSFIMNRKFSLVASGILVKAKKLPR